MQYLGKLHWDIRNDDGCQNWDKKIIQYDQDLDSWLIHAYGERFDQTYLYGLDRTNHIEIWAYYNKDDREHHLKSIFIRDYRIGARKYALPLNNDKTLESHQVIKYSLDPLSWIIKCPVDAELIDPEGLMITKEYCEISNASYERIDLNEDGDSDILITINEPKLGNYTLTIIPYQDAEPEDVVTVSVVDGFYTNSSPLILIDNITISELPLTPFIYYNAPIGIITAPESNFSYQIIHDTIPNSYLFTDTSTGNITSHLWSFGDGTFAENVTEVTHTYSQSGNYTITLTVSGPDGEDTSSQVIEVLPPQCTLFGNATIFGNPAPVGSLVTASAAGFNQSVVIEQEGRYGESEIGHGLVLQGDIPTGSPITFTINGSPAWFGLPDEYGNTTWLGTSFPFFPNSILHVDLDVPTTLTADFSASQGSGEVPLNVIFTDLSEGDPFIRIWDFGDGTNETTDLNSTHHSYVNPGVYSVHLTVKRGAAHSELMKTDFITVTYPLPPIANFTSNTTFGKVPLSIQFTDNSIGEDITSSLWSFGDGETSTETNPTHTYITPGIFDVALTIRNKGGENTTTKLGYIKTEFPPIYIDISTSDISGLAPLEVTFTGHTTEEVSYWRWDFGDGTTSNLESPSHIYSNPGTYDVGLSVIVDGRTGSITKSNYIIVADPSERVSADFNAAPKFGAAPLPVSFTDTSEGQPTSWQWDFGDGHSSQSQSPMNVYMKGGTYSVTLLASNGFGSDIEVKKDLITVYQTFPGQKRPPGDIDADGKFEDLNGDRQLNKDDYNLFIKNFKWIRNNEPVTLFDYSNNNRIDDLDIILLKREIISKS